MSGVQKYSDDDLRRVAGIKDELFEHALKTIQENLETMIAPVTKKMDKIGQDVEEIKDDMKAVRVAIRDTNKDLQLLENRVDSLEATA